MMRRIRPESPLSRPEELAKLTPEERVRSLREMTRRRKGYRITALDLKIGEPCWSRWVDGHAISAPTIYEEEAYVTTFAGTLYKFRLADGEILVARRCRATSAPVVVDDAVFLTRRSESEDGTPATEQIAKFDRLTGEPIYSIHSGKVDHPDPPLGDVSAMQQYCGPRLLALSDRLYNGIGPEFLCTDAATGQREWGLFVASAEYNPGDVAAGPAALAGGKLFLASLRGELLQIDPKNGAVDRRIQLKAPVATEPIIDGGRVFLGTRDGQLLCVNLGDETITGWNQWGGSAGHAGPPLPMPSTQQVSQSSMPPRE